MRIHSSIPQREQSVRCDSGVAASRPALAVIAALLRTETQVLTWPSSRGGPRVKFELAGFTVHREGHPRHRRDSDTSGLPVARDGTAAAAKKSQRRSTGHAEVARGLRDFHVALQLSPRLLALTILSTPARTTFIQSLGSGGIQYSFRHDSFVLKYHSGVRLRRAHRCASHPAPTLTRPPG
jgi:hypothetical protein